MENLEQKKQKCIICQRIDAKVELARKSKKGFCGSANKQIKILEKWQEEHKKVCPSNKCEVADGQTI